jgi:hypothetical protein
MTEGFAAGRKQQLEIDKMYIDNLETALSSAIRANRELKVDLEVLGRVQWRKLSRLILSRSIIGSVIGCGMILAVAVGLSHL